MTSNKTTQSSPDDDEDRFCEYGVVGSEQVDETYFDGRHSKEEDDDEEQEEDDGAFGATGKIKFSAKKLYGREKEVARLLALYYSMVDRKQNTEDNQEENGEDQEEKEGTGLAYAVFLSAFSGAGKTALVDEFVRQLRTQRSDKKPQCLFLNAKYEVLQTTTPFSAFGTLFDNIESETQNEIQFERDFIKKKMGEDVAILSKIFPSLTKELGIKEYIDDEVDSSLGSLASHLTRTKSLSTTFLQRQKISKERLKSSILSFFQTLSTNVHPLILFIDDLQWADEQSLELIKILLTAESLSHLFFVGAYRSNEVGDDHELSKTITAINQKSRRDVEQIQLQQLSIEAVGEFIADTLRLDVKEVEPLTQVIYSKTLGNPFYTRQAMEYLVRKNALYYDTISFRWSWNLHPEELEELISDDMVEMVKHKIFQLSDKMQSVMLVASHTRTSFDSEMLLELMDAGVSSSIDDKPAKDRKLKIENVTCLLNEAVEEGLLVCSKSSKKGFSFAHDRIEEAARSLISEHEREGFLGRLGHALHDRACSDCGEDWMYFAAARHLNATSSFSKDRTECLKLASLNLRTAELSLELLAFSAAAEFCKKGILNLPDDLWQSQYSLALSLHTVGAEAEYGAGNMEMAMQYCETILKHPKKSIFDVLPAYKVRLDILTAKGEKKEAFQLSFTVMEELGYKFPREETKMVRLKAWKALKQVRSRHLPTEESIDSMSEASDQDTIDTMEFIQKAGSLAFQVEKTYLYVLLCCKSIRLMTEHGLIDSSASVIASFANILMHVHGDFVLSTKLAYLAIKVSGRLKNKFHEPRALNTANAFVLGWVRPLQSCLKYHVQAYDSGMISGNIEGAGVAKMFASWVMLYSGMPLLEVELFCRKAVLQLRKLESSFDANLICMVRQCSLNLLGKPGNDNTSALIGEAMDQTNEPFTTLPLKSVVNIWSRFLCCFFGDVEEEAKSALENGGVFMKKMIGMMYGLEIFHRGMLFYGMARRGETIYRKPAQKVLKDLKALVKKGCFNLVGPTRLLEGEQAALAGKSKQARSAFEQAISICINKNALHYAALSCERYAHYLIEQKDNQKGNARFLEAIDYYRRWGATQKIKLLQRQIDFSHKSNNNKTSSVSIRETAGD